MLGSASSVAAPPTLNAPLTRKPKESLSPETTVTLITAEVLLRAFETLHALRRKQIKKGFTRSQIADAIQVVDPT